MKKLSIKDRILNFLSLEKSFFKDVSFVMGGKMIISIISILLTPILTRLYPPTAYGEFALYSTVLLNLIAIGGMSLPLAISTSSKNMTSSVLSLFLTFNTGFLLFFGVTMFFLKEYLDSIFSTLVFTNYWHLLIASYFLTSLVAAFAALNVRLKRFMLNTVVSLTDIGSAKVTNLICGSFGLGGLGLIISEVTGKFIGLIVHLKKIPTDIKLSFLSAKKFKSVLISVKEFPLYIFPSHWIELLSNQLIIWYIAYQFSTYQLGQFSMAVALLNIPLNLLSNSFQPVIMQRLVVLKEDNVNIAFFNKILMILIAISSACFITIYLIPSSFYTFFLGEKWTDLGSIIQILCWSSLVVLIDQSLQSGFVVYNAKKAKLAFSGIEAVFQVILLLLIMQFHFGLESSLKYYVLVKIFISVTKVGYLWRVSKLLVHG